MSGAPPSPPAILIAYAGTAAGASALLPAVERLRASRPDAVLSLLWPAHVPVPQPLAALVRRRIPYPSRGPDSVSLRRAIEGLRAARADCAVVFTEEGWSADFPAYLAYLGGILSRYGIEAEFGGGVLSHVAAEPHAGEPDRHLFLLRAHGLAQRIPPPVFPAVARGG